MYICICNAIREKDLRCAARCQAGDAETLYEAMGHIPRCCQCLHDADVIVASERASIAV